jgi:hypothetical protein
MVPLSYVWHNGGLVFSTVERSRTIRNLRRAGGSARAGLGTTHDVVMVDGAIEFFAAEDDQEAVEAFVAHVTWDPRNEPQPYIFFRLRAVRIQAWQTAADLPTREVMRDGVWVDGGS